MIRIALACLATTLAAGDDAAKATPEAVVVSGKVLTLAESLKPFGVKADAEPTAGQVVLVADDGAVTPLLSDEASRALFQDERLRNRPATIHGRRFDGLPYLQVTSFQVEDHGAMRTPE